MTNAPRAQSQQSDVEWLREYAVRPKTVANFRFNDEDRLLAIADALEQKDAEIARLNAVINAQHEARNVLAGDINLTAVKRASEFEVQLATCRAENAALAKLADELSVDHRDDDTFDAGVRYALFILGFEKEAVEANDASKALRAGQQK